MYVFSDMHSELCNNVTAEWELFGINLKWSEEKLSD